MLRLAISIHFTYLYLMNQKQMWQIARESSIVNPVRSVPVNLDAQQQFARLLNFNHRKESESTICPWYSRRQLRTIRRLRIKQKKYGRGSIKKLSHNIAFDRKRRSGHNIRGYYLTQEIEDYTALLRGTFVRLFSPWNTMIKL